MAYFNGKKVFFSPKIVKNGVDKATLETAINDKTETISAYTPVMLTDMSAYVSWLRYGAVVVTEDMVANGLYILNVSKEIAAGDYAYGYLISGVDVDHMYNEQTTYTPKLGEVGENLIETHNLSVGYVIAKEQDFESDGWVFVTPSKVECVTKENLDNILTNM